MGTVTIGGNPYEIYGTEAAADVYWAGGLGEGADAWAVAAAITDRHKQSLVAATRLLDRMPWIGTPVGTPVIDVVLQWPRSGIDGVSSLSVPDVVQKACYELAAALLVDSDLQTQATTGSNVKHVVADTVEVEFFQGTLGITGPLPKQVMDLIGVYLSGSSVAAGSTLSYGVDAESQFDDDDAYDVSSTNT